ncbi:MAG: hypothetical protein R2748_19510 [Bryobacterales bacterium]
MVFTVWPKALETMDWNSRAIRTIADFNAWHITPNRAGTRSCAIRFTPTSAYNSSTSATARAKPSATPRRPAKGRSGRSRATP